MVLEAIVDHGPNWDKQKDDGENDAGKGGSDLDKASNVEDLSVEDAEHEDWVEGPHESNDGDEVGEEFGHETWHLVWHAVASEEDILQMLMHQSGTLLAQ